MYFTVTSAYYSIIFDRQENHRDRGEVGLVARDLAYHVISLNTQCLWVTPTPIPGLHRKKVLDSFDNVFHVYLMNELQK